MDLFINGTQIERKSHAKYLGVILEDNLTFEEHTKHIIGKLVKGNAIISNIRHFMPHNLMKNIYSAHIQPHINYELLLWGFANDGRLKRVNNLQRKALRLINFKTKRYANMEELYKENKILPTRQCLSLKAGKMLWDVYQNKAPVNICSLFQKRHLKFFQQYRRINLTQKCLTYEGVKMWNKIPSNICNCKIIASFQRELKKHLFSSF